MAIATPARAAPDDIIARPLVLAPDQIAADLVLEVNVASTYVGKPTSLAPDVWFGLARGVTIGIVHSDPSVDRFEPGASLCLHSGVLTCDRLYHGGGIDLRWSAREGDLAFAPRARFLVRDVDPFKPAVTLGTLVRWQRGRIALIGDPYLQLGLLNMDQGNRAAIVLPIELAIQPTCRWAISLHTGWDADVAVWRDGWEVPVALGTLARVTAQLDVGATLGFQHLLGPLNTPKDRVVFITVGWRGE